MLKVVLSTFQIELSLLTKFINVKIFITDQCQPMLSPDVIVNNRIVTDQLGLTKNASMIGGPGAKLLQLFPNVTFLHAASCSVTSQMGSHAGLIVCGEITHVASVDAAIQVKFLMVDHGFSAFFIIV